MRVSACCPARHSTAPIVNSATGDAESASILTPYAAGPGSDSPVAADNAPRAIAYGCGFVNAARSARPAVTHAEPGGASIAPRPRSSAPAPTSTCTCASVRHAVLVRNRSTSKVLIAGPAAAAAAGPRSPCDECEEGQDGRENRWHAASGDWLASIAILVRKQLTDLSTHRRTHSRIRVVRTAAAPTGSARQAWRAGRGRRCRRGSAKSPRTRRAGAMNRQRGE